MVRRGNHEDISSTDMSIWLLCFNLILCQRMKGKAFENALIDKLGENDIKWEKDGFIDSS